MTLIAAVLLLAAIWIVVPPPNAWLLPVAIVVRELSPILLAVSAITLLLCFRKGLKKIAALLSLAAVGLSAIPLTKVSATIRRFDADLAAVFPKAGAPGAWPMRPSPIDTHDLFLGISTTQPRISRAVQFAAPEGLPLVADIYKPEAPGKYPMILQIHGGSWQRGTRSDQESFARYFATHGYVVISVEYRLAPRWKWPAQLEDVRAALNWISQHESSFEGDADRIAIVGRSAGGHLALLAAYGARTSVRAVVSYYGPTDLTGGWNDPPKPDPVRTRTLLETFIGGTPEGMPFKYREASPVTYAGGGVPATLQIQGAEDHVVRPRFARDLHQRLKTAGARSVLLEIPWAEHAFDQIPQGLGGQLSLYYTERFLAAAFAPRR